MDQQQMSRREFVAVATAVVAACGACATCSLAAGIEVKAEKVDVGTLADYPKDGIYDKFAKDKHFFVIRHEGELYATSAICTHKNNQLYVKGQEIVCKKHGSKFSEYGTATKGPAKNSLPRFAITQNDEKHLIVDTAKEFHEKEWEKDGAFIKIA